LCALGVASVLGASAISWIGGTGYLGLDYDVVVLVGFIPLTICTILAIFSLSANVSFVTIKPWRDLMQKIDSNACRRVVKTREPNKEYLIHGPCTSILREILFENWPFEDVELGSD